MPLPDSSKMLPDESKMLPDGSKMLPADALRVFVTMSHIVKHLSSEDLENCLQAYDCWDDVIESEKRLRKDVYPFLWSWWCEKHGRIHQCPLIEEQPRSIHHDIRVKVKNYSSRHCVPLLFSTPRLLENAEIFFPGIQPTVITAEFRRWQDRTDLNYAQMEEVTKVTQKLRELVVKAVRRYFPDSLQVVYTISHSIMGCGEDLKLIDIASKPALTGFIIPQYPGFEIHNFELKSPGKFDTIPVDANIKGLLVFSSGHITFNRVMRLVHKRVIRDIAIGGFNNVEMYVPRNGSIVAFCGENVETASLVINPYDNAWERKLRLFRETGLLVNTCFAFAFNTREIDEKLIHKPVRMFKRLYPNIPLAGVSSSEIYGVDHLPGVSEEIKALFLDKLLIDDRVEFTHEKETVFVLISIKP